MIRKTFACSLVLAFATMSPALVIWNEANQGDLSNVRSSPTTLTLPGGIDVVIASTQSGDLEYFTLIVPLGCKVDRLILSGYQSGDARAFLAIQKGSPFTEPNVGTNVANLLGYCHFGPGANPVGSDLLIPLGTGPGSQGFSGPLYQGTYTYWVQQLGAKTDWEMQWHVSAIPEPASLSALAVGVLALKRRKRR